MAIVDVSEIRAVVAEERRFTADGTALTLGYQIVHGTDVLEEGQFGAAVAVDTPRLWAMERKALMRKVEDVLVRVRTREKARSELGDRSIVEVAPWLDGWRVRPASGEGRFTLHHPVDDQEFHLFVFNEGQMGEDGLPTQKAIFGKLVGKCLEGVDATAEAGAQAGEVTVGIAGALAGAVEYRWYARPSWGRWPDQVWVEWANGDGSDVELANVEAQSWEVRCCALAGDGVRGLLGAGVVVAVS